MQEILFICTGNYYRSRYAEALFNHEASRRGLNWRAFSRGVAVWLAPTDGLSPHAKQRMIERGIPAAPARARPTQLDEQDLLRASRVIALKETEHRAIIARLHPGWENKIEYWEISDLDLATAATALAAIEEKVETLLADLSGAQG